MSLKTARRASNMAGVAAACRSRESATARSAPSTAPATSVGASSCRTAVRYQSKPDRKPVPRRRSPSATPGSVTVVSTGSGPSARRTPTAPSR